MKTYSSVVIVFIVFVATMDWGESMDQGSQGNYFLRMQIEPTRKFLLQKVKIYALTVDRGKLPKTRY